MDFLELVNEPINANEIICKVTAPQCGGISMFLGTTRNNFDGLEVVKLEYEAYNPMALSAMKKICVDVRQKWSTIGNIAIYHRLGEVPVGECSVLIAISSEHRAECIAAVTYSIEALKATVPIWKKELYKNSDKESEWKSNTECTWSKS